MSADAYLEALAHFNKCDADVSRVAVNILGVGNQLKNNRSYFSFRHIASTLPPEASRSKQSADFNANNWPDVPKLMGMLAGWHAAKDAALAAWSKIPLERQANLTPPPGVERGDSRLFHSWNISGAATV